MENLLEKEVVGREKLDLFEHVFSDFEVVKPFITMEKIQITDIITPTNRARKQGLKGLKASVGQFGILLPPVVMKTENKRRYILINGVRRLYAAMKNGITEIDVIVYNFDDSVKAKKAIPILELILNHYEQYSVNELWDAAKFIKERAVNASPEMIEYLLNLRPGEYTKLYDVMNSSEAEMVEVVEQLKDGVVTIDQAYKKLDGIRKKLSRQELLNQKDELQIGGDVGVFKEALETLQDSAQPIERERLDDDEIKSLLNLASCNMNNIDVVDLSELDRTSELRQIKRRDTKERHPVDPALRKARMIKDNFTCQGCLDISGEEHMYILDFHHVVPVSLGGEDSIENGATLCLNCHQLVHLYASGDLFLDINTLDKVAIAKFKRILSLGNVIVDAMRKLNVSKDEYKKVENPHFVGRKFPGHIKRELDKA